MGINDFIAATVRRALPDGNFWLNFFTVSSKRFISFPHLTRFQ